MNFKIGRLSLLIEREMSRLEDSGVDGGGAFLRNKRLFELQAGERPAPDGLSTSYLELSIAKNRAARAQNPSWPDQGDGPSTLSTLAVLLHEEIEQAILLERRLFEAANCGR
jgi:hypothetical protein